MPLVEQMYNSLMEDPDLEIGEDQTREEAARIEAEQRARQYINNVQALSLANEPLNKEYFPHLLFAGLILKALDGSGRDLLIRNFSEAFGDIVRGKPEYASPQKAKKALRNLISEAVAGGATQADINYARKHAVERYSDVSELGGDAQVTTKKMKEILSEYGIDVRAKGDLFRISRGKGISKPKKDLVYDPRGKNQKAYGKGKLRDFAKAKARSNAGKKQTKAQKAKKEPVEISEDDVNEIMEHEQRLEEFMSEVHGEDWRDKADRDRKQNKLHGLHKVVDRYQKYPKELENDHKIKIIDPAKNAPDIEAKAKAAALEAQEKQDAIDLKERQKAEGVAKKERIKQAKQLPHGKGHIKPHLNAQGKASPVRATKHARELIAHLQKYNDEMQEDPALMKKFHEAIQEAIDHGADISKIREEINEHGENFGTPEQLQQALNKDIKLAEKHERQRKAIGIGEHVGSSSIQDAMDNPDGHHHFDDLSPEHEALINNFKESRTKLQQGKDSHEDAKVQLEGFTEWEKDSLTDASDKIKQAQTDYDEMIKGSTQIMEAFNDRYPDYFTTERRASGEGISKDSPEWKDFQESDVFKEIMKPYQEELDKASQAYDEKQESFNKVRPQYEDAVGNAQQNVDELQSSHDEIEKEFNDSNISEQRKLEVHGTKTQKTLSDKPEMEVGEKEASEKLVGDLNDVNKKIEDLKEKGRMTDILSLHGSMDIFPDASAKARGEGYAYNKIPDIMKKLYIGQELTDKESELWEKYKANYSDEKINKRSRKMDVDYVDDHPDGQLIDGGIGILRRQQIDMIENHNKQFHSGKDKKPKQPEEDRKDQRIELEGDLQNAKDRLKEHEDNLKEYEEEQAGIRETGTDKWGRPFDERSYNINRKNMKGLVESATMSVEDAQRDLDAFDSDEGADLGSAPDIAGQKVAPEDEVTPDTGPTQEELDRQALEAKMALENRVINPATGRWIKKENLDELQQGMGDFDGKLVNGAHQFGDHHFAVDDNGNAVDENFFVDIHGNIVPVNDSADLSDEDSMSNKELIGRHFGQLLGGEGGNLESHKSNPEKVSDVKDFWLNNKSPLAKKIAEKAKKNAERRRAEETEGMSFMDRFKRGYKEGEAQGYQKYKSKILQEHKGGFEASYRQAKAKNKNLSVADHARVYFADKPDVVDYIDAKMKDKTLTPKKHREKLAGLNEPSLEDFSYNPIGNQRNYNRPIEKGYMTNINLFLNFIKDQQTHEALTAERDINRLIEHVKHNKKIKKEV